MIGKTGLVKLNETDDLSRPALITRLEEMARQVQERDVRIVDLEHEQHARFTELAELIRRLVSVEAELERTQSALAQELVQRDQMKQSVSWRITAPLRKIKDTLRQRRG